VTRRLALALATTLSLASVAPPARADLAACTAAYTNGQRERQDGKLRDARRDLVVCAQDECPSALRKDCVAWLADVEKALPSIAIQVRGPDGCDRPDAKAFLDDVAVPGDGRATDLDPGAHVLRVDLDGAIQTQSVIATAGERERVIRVSYADASVSCNSPRGPRAAPLVAPVPPPPPGAERARPIPTLAYVLGGVGIVGLAVGAGFGVSAFHQKSTLDECKGHCAQSDVDAMRTKFLVTDLGVGIGLVALVAATVITLTR
jgi:hypothetical protein